MSGLPRPEWAHRAEVLATALERFRTHPMQTALTLVGLFVGTGAIVLMVALGLTGRDFVMAQIEGVGTHLVWANYRGTVSSGVSRPLEDWIREADIRAVGARTDLFIGVTALLSVHGTIAVQSGAADLTVLGTLANYPRVRKNLRILRGRFLDDDDVSGQQKVCVVNRHLYEELWGNEDAIGRTIRTLGLSFEVIGEFEEPVDTLGQGDVTPETVFIPLSTCWFFTQSHRVDTLFAEVRDFDKIEAATQAVGEILRERHFPGSHYEVQSLQAVIRVANSISWGLVVVFIVVAGVSVVVGGVGIMNILLASVEQRTREIGIRRSVGARRRDILNQFLYEALLLGMVGSALGVVGGLGVPLLIRLFVRKITIEVSPLSAVLAFLFSCGVTVLFGLIPAQRAARMDPVEALRHE